MENKERLNQFKLHRIRKASSGTILDNFIGATINKYVKLDNLKTPEVEDIEFKSNEVNAPVETTTISNPEPTTTTERESWTKSRMRTTGAQLHEVSHTNASSQSQSTPVQVSTTSDLELRMKLAMDYLQLKGFNKEAAAGIIGVFTAESGLKTGIENKTEKEKYGASAGKGIGQWSNNRRKQYDDAMSGKSGSLTDELDFFISDLESRPLVKLALASATSVEDAVKAMHLGYENGSSAAMATPEQMTATYTKAWDNLPGHKKYDYNHSHGVRLSYGLKAFNLA